VYGVQGNGDRAASWAAGELQEGVVTLELAGLASGTDYAVYAVATSAYGSPSFSAVSEIFLLDVGTLRLSEETQNNAALVVTSLLLLLF